MRMGDEGRDDPDRAAILARRQRFIALALSGLSASCGKTSGPQVCLSIGPGESSTTDDGSGSGSGSDSGSSSTGMPMPCLDIGPMTTESSADDTGTSGTTDDTGTTDETGTTDDTGTTGDTGSTGA
jgi:hypothetical protein